MNQPPVYQWNAVRKTLSPSFSLDVELLTILPGEIFCLLGPTGAGKSTFLRLLSGLELPSSGHLSLNGCSFERGPVPTDVLRRIAMVHQRPLLLSQTVRYNVEYGLRIRNIRSVGDRVDPLLERLGMRGLANQDARTLSGGQMQLVSLARALATNPDVLLLDEPTANLDPAYVGLVESVVQERQRQTGMTVVWATHNLFQARRVAGRAGLLLGGKLIEVADVSDFFDCPSDERTLQFIQGKMVY
ncbi:MAG: ATP-binding cassette domain-containing protein [Planctomycetaceae bacterium]